MYRLTLKDPALVTTCTLMTIIQVITQAASCDSTKCGRLPDRVIYIRNPTNQKSKSSPVMYLLLDLP